MESTGGPRARRARASSHAGAVSSPENDCPRPARGARLQEAAQDGHDPASPRQRVAQRTEQCSSCQRERQQNGNGVAVHRAIEALPPPHVHARPTVNPRLERGEEEQRTASEQAGVESEAPEPEARRRPWSGVERVPLTHTQRCEPEHAKCQTIAMASETNAMTGRRGPPISAANGVGVAA